MEFEIRIKILDHQKNGVIDSHVMPLSVSLKYRIRFCIIFLQFFYNVRISHQYILSTKIISGLLDVVDSEMHHPNYLMNQNNNNAKIDNYIQCATESYTNT